MHTTHMAELAGMRRRSIRFVPCACTLLVTLLLVGIGDAHAQRSVERWIAESELEIPKSAFPGEYPIVGRMAVGPDGRMYVSLPYRYKVAIFDRSGKLIKTFGGEGEEPGQLKTQVTPFSWRVDSLVITDLGLKQLTFWDVEGRHLMNQQFSNPTSQDGCYKPGTVRGILTDGNGIVAPGTQITCVDKGVIESPILRVDRNGQVLDTLAWLDRKHDLLLAGPPTPIQSRVIAPQYLRDGSLWSIAPDGSWIVLVNRRSAVQPEGTTFEVIKIDPAGDTLFAGRYPYRALETPAASLDSAVTLYEGIAERHGTFGSAAEAHDSIRAAAYLPRYRTPITRVVAGRDGTVWLRRELARRDSVEWNVIGPDGEMNATLMLPRSLTVYQAQRDMIWGTAGEVRSSIPGVWVKRPVVVRYRVRVDLTGRPDNEMSRQPERSET